MLLKKLIFDNYKTYYGLQEVDLYIPESIREEGKNIILLGGLNGAGKTTILKAILYVLFGKRGISEEEHKRLFSNIVNNTFFDEGGRQSSVTLIVETDSGEEWKLKVKWYFDKYKRLTHEERNLIVSKPGSRVNRHAKIDNIETYNKFIDKIIPYHAAPFFIFDGEEIKDIILRQNSHEMKQAIHKITGMDAYNQLITDLQSLQKNIEKKLASSSSNSKIKDYDEQLNELTKTMKRLEQKRSKISAEHEKLKNLLLEEKERRNKKVTQNSKSRETFVKKQSKIETQMDLAKKELSTFFKENAISIILSEKLTKLKNQLKLEDEVKRKRIIENSSLTPYRNFMNQLLSEKIDPPLTDTQLKQIKELGKEIWLKENNINNTSTTDIQEIHDLSGKDHNFLTNYIISDKSKMAKLINYLESLENEYQNIENEIRNAPESVNIDKENERIDSLTQMIGECNLRLRSVNKKLNEAKSNKANITNKLTRLSGQEVDLEELQNKYSLTKKTILAMEQYVEEVTTMKAQYIQEEFSYMLNKLFRKQDEFGKIEFDIDSYTIRLYNDKLQEISIQDRSAGEMQMISSSLIWALTKASDLALPIVVDTPLGRLDSHHRNRLINHYYKELSEQVIILSTDTEITEEYVKLMEDHSYKQYMLDYDEKKKYTVIRDGYFDFVTE
ncbi:DNA sulfur modification protein DndD [Sediminibacillus massiliensis]|uniref:DNA sulfur modification protein DndD n=1 Tax=Sediminibacillus massiliensis TaxID=1926277 RepID=UPI00098893B4|nr:DNA sulfur modification protein DndD [Sediminibacillus massiliensis]